MVLVVQDGGHRLYLVSVTPRIGDGGGGTERSAEMARVNPLRGPHTRARATSLLAARGREAKRNKTTAKQSPLLMLLYKSPLPKNVYASAIGLCKDSIIMQSRKPSNSDFWRSFSM